MQLKDQSSLNSVGISKASLPSLMQTEPKNSLSNLVNSSKLKEEIKPEIKKVESKVVAPVKSATISTTPAPVNPLSQYFKNGGVAQKKIDDKIFRTSSHFSPDKNEVFKSLEGLASSSSGKKELLKKVQEKFGGKKEMTTDDLLGFFSESIDPTKNKDFRKAGEFIEKNFGVKKDFLNSYSRKMAIQKERMIQQENRVISAKKEAFQTLRGIGKRVNESTKSSLGFSRFSSPGSSLSAQKGNVRGSKLIRLANNKI